MGKEKEVEPGGNQVNERVHGWECGTEGSCGVRVCVSEEWFTVCKIALLLSTSQRWRRSRGAEERLQGSCMITFRIDWGAHVCSVLACVACVLVGQCVKYVALFVLLSDSDLPEESTLL